MSLASLHLLKAFSYLYFDKEKYGFQTRTKIETKTRTVELRLDVLQPWWSIGTTLTCCPYRGLSMPSGEGPPRCSSPETSKSSLWLPMKWHTDLIQVKPCEWEGERETSKNGIGYSNVTINLCVHMAYSATILWKAPCNVELKMINLNLFIILSS